MEVKSFSRYVRMSPRKVRLVADLVRGMAAEEARVRLQFLNKTAALVMLKLLNSAVANASHNFQFKKENLYIQKITVDGGSTLKRWHPRAFGRAAPIRKRSSHITLVLGEKQTKNAKKEK